MREAVCILGLAIFAVIACLNATLAFRQFILRQNHVPSMIPIIGGLIGFGSCTVAPWPTIRELSYLPLLLDVGTGPYLLLAIAVASPFYFRQRFSRLVASFEATNLPGRKIVLELRTRGLFRLELTWQRPKGQTGVTKWPLFGSWSRQNGSIVLSAPQGKIVLLQKGRYLEQSEGLGGIEKSADTSLQNAKFICVKGSVPQNAA